MSSGERNLKDKCIVGDHKEKDGDEEEVRSSSTSTNAMRKITPMTETKSFSNFDGCAADKAAALQRKRDGETSSSSKTLRSSALDGETISMIVQNSLKERITSNSSHAAAQQPIYQSETTRLPTPAATAKAAPSSYSSTYYPAQQSTKKSKCRIIEEEKQEEECGGLNHQSLRSSALDDSTLSEIVRHRLEGQPVETTTSNEPAFTKPTAVAADIQKQRHMDTATICPPPPLLAPTITLPGAHQINPSFCNTSAAAHEEQEEQLPSLVDEELAPEEQQQPQVWQQQQLLLQDCNNLLAVANPVDSDDDQSVLTIAMADNSEKLDRERKQFTWFFFCGFVFMILLIVAIVLAVVLTTTTKKNNENQGSETTFNITESQPPTTNIIPNQSQGLLMDQLPQHTLKALEDPNSPQSKAYEWLLLDQENNLEPDLSVQRAIQRFSLACIYFAGQGDSWLVNDNWLSTHHECTWSMKNTFGMMDTNNLAYPGWLSGFFPNNNEPPKSPCDEEGKFKHLWLDQNGLDGSLPEELYLLTSLESLSFGYDSLSATISTNIASLTELQGLSFIGLKNAHTIPSEMGLLTNLRALILSNNNHEGSIPSEIWNLTALEHLNLLNPGPLLQGSIPSSVGLFPKLQWLIISGCNVTGTIPRSLGNVETLTFLGVAQNKVTGKIPTQIGLLSNLETLSLMSNALTGSIPPELSAITILNKLSLRDNLLTGTIPSELGLLRNLTLFFSLHGQFLHGRIPSELGLMRKLSSLTLNSNMLEGWVPSQLGNLSSLGYLALANNSLSGAIPDALEPLHETLYYMNIQGNPSLSGTIPDGLCNLNGTCTKHSFSLNPCSSNQYHVMFDCTELLCGCTCPCLD